MGLPNLQLSQITMFGNLDMNSMSLSSFEISCLAIFGEDCFSKEGKEGRNDVDFKRENCFYANSNLKLDLTDFSNNYLNISQDKTIDIFSMIPNIQYLTLRNVQLDSISYIGNFIPADVIYLDLSFNNIKIIEKYQFRKNGLNPLTIDLSYNSIEIIEKDSFYDLNIFHLDLSNNKIKNLRTYELFNSLELNTLIMSNNLILNIEQLSRNYFEKMSKMIFSFNSLEKFDCEIYFNNRNKLSKLFLDNNLLKEISNKSFYILYKLKESNY